MNRCVETKRTELAGPLACSGLAVRGDAGQRVAYGQRVDLLGALVGKHGLEVVRVPDRGVFQRYTAGPEDRPGLPGDVDSRPDVRHLGDADLHRVERARLLEPAQVQREHLSPA